MSIYTEMSLNRILIIKNDGDQDENEDFFDESYQKYFLDILSIVKEYNIETVVCFLEGKLCLVIHNNIGKTVLGLSSGEVYDLPDIPDDETFEQRSTNFIKLLKEKYPEVSNFEELPIKKRIFTFS